MWKLYLIGVLGSFRDSLFTLSWLSGIAIIVLGIILLFQLEDYYFSDEELNPLKKNLKIAVVICVTSLLVSGIIPGKRTLYAIVGLDAMIEYVNSNETIRDTSSKTLKIINKELDKYLEEDEAN